MRTQQLSANPSLLSGSGKPECFAKGRSVEALWNSPRERGRRDDRPRGSRPCIPPLLRCSHVKSLIVTPGISLPRQNCGQAILVTEKDGNKNKEIQSLPSLSTLWTRGGGAAAQLWSSLGIRANAVRSSGLPVDPRPDGAAVRDYRIVGGPRPPACVTDNNGKVAPSDSIALKCGWGPGTCYCQPGRCSRPGAAITGGRELCTVTMHPTHLSRAFKAGVKGPVVTWDRGISVGTFDLILAANATTSGRRDFRPASLRTP